MVDYREIDKLNKLQNDLRLAKCELHDRVEEVYNRVTEARRWFFELRSDEIPPNPEEAPYDLGLNDWEICGDMIVVNHEYFDTDSMNDFTHNCKFFTYFLHNEELLKIFERKSKWKSENYDKAEYTEDVKFSSTNNYGCGPKDEDDVYTVEEFEELVESFSFIDSDGHGYPVKDKKACTNWIVKPSEINQLPIDATHIVWYNK